MQESFQESGIDESTKIGSKAKSRKHQGRETVAKSIKEEISGLYQIQ